ncbi:YibE/F family protein [Candidatus Parcubacteria bacterium]|nr:YibE/F family protein [Candidatus Parcubacteria bacterium]
MKKIIFLLLLLLFIPNFALAQADINEDVIFKAEVIEILAEEMNQQYLKLRGLEGEFDNKEIEFNGISDLDVINSQKYKKGDKVMMAASYDASGEVNFYVIDYVRSKSLLFLGLAFFLTLIIVGRLKGLRSLIALAITFFIIIKYLIPQILSGANPIMVTFVSALVILAAIIYITEGIKARAHLSALSIFLSLVITITLSELFVSLARLTGAASEETLFLFNIQGASIDLTGLLLAGIIIGVLGVLDDVVISQVSTVEQLKLANKHLSQKELFKKAYQVGISHIASMTNTLFLAYAGASLPLLILFGSGTSAFASWQQAINTELIATEIVRTLTGSIGLILAVPIATFIASWWYSRRT